MDNGVTTVLQAPDYFLTANNQGIVIQDSRSKELLFKNYLNGKLLGVDSIGTTLFVGIDHSVVEWDLQTREARYIYTCGETVSHCLTLAGDSLLVIATGNSVLHVWDRTEKIRQAVLNAHLGRITGLVAVSDTQFASVGLDQTIKFWQQQEKAWDLVWSSQPQTLWMNNKLSESTARLCAEKGFFQPTTSEVTQVEDATQRPGLRFFPVAQCVDVFQANAQELNRDLRSLGLQMKVDNAAQKPNVVYEKTTYALTPQDKPR